MTNLEGNLTNILNMKNSIEPNNLRKGVTIWNINGNKDYNTPINFTGEAKIVSNDYLLSYINLPSDTVAVYYNANNYYFNGAFVNNNGVKTSIINVTATKNDVIDGAFYGANGAGNVDVIREFSSNTITNELVKATEVLSLLNYDIYTANLATVTNAYCLFSKAYNIRFIPNYNYSKVTNSAFMLEACSNIVDIDTLNLFNSTSTYCMFDNCTNLATINYIDISNVVNAQSMFYFCSNLKRINTFITSNKLSSIGWMFFNCRSLEVAPNMVTNIASGTQSMFDDCYNLVSVPKYNTASVTNMRYMFSGCYNLVTVPQFNTSKVTTMYRMFESCNNLSNASIQNIINMCLNSNITSTTYKNLNTSNSYGPFYGTNITSSRYSNRTSALTSAGWNY